MNASTAHLGLYDTLADWEIGYLLVELRSGRYTRRPWNIVTVAESREPITTLGGLRIMPEMILDDLDPADSNLFILPGADMWDVGGGEAFAAAAARFLTQGFPSRLSAVRRPVSPEPGFWTNAATPARQPST
jgi:hypothetical protein